MGVLPTVCNDTVCFKEPVHILKNYSSTSERFLEYFRRQLKANLQHKVNEPSRKAPLCNKWMNNNCESINHILKQTVDWKSKGLTKFAQLTHTIVIGQFEEVKWAQLGIGKFRIVPSHGRFKVSKTDYMYTHLSLSKWHTLISFAFWFMWEKHDKNYEMLNCNTSWCLYLLQPSYICL